MIIRATGLVVRYPGAPRDALDGVSLTLAPGEVVAAVGPNGSGKSTLVRALLGVQPLVAGQVSLDNRPLAAWSPSAIAQAVGVVTQQEAPLPGLRAEDVVLFGRYARLGPLAAPGPGDWEAVRQALARVDAWELRDRPVANLSGGEWQRVRLARALAQVPRVLVLDEPTASLDVRHEMELLECVADLVREGLACLLVTHHLNLAARYADRLVLMHRGRVAADGAPADVLRQERLAEVFEWPVAVTTWCDGSPQVVPLRPGEERLPHRGSPSLPPRNP